MGLEQHVNTPTHMEGCAGQTKTELKASPVYKNYRPLSNLSYMWKLTEKVVAKQTVHHLDTSSKFLDVLESMGLEQHVNTPTHMEGCAGQTKTELKASPVYKNYRPLSNLSYMWELTEKVVAKQTVHHLDTHNLFPVNQSAYRESHSTVPALLKVCNDILLNMDTQQVTFLILLDLSAAFDTIDHSILLDCLHNNFGFTDDSLAWFRSYL